MDVAQQCFNWDFVWMDWIELHWIYPGGVRYRAHYGANNNNHCLLQR